MENKKKILLIGGEGFIGRNIAAELAGEFFCYSLGLEETIFSANRGDVYIKGNPYKNEVNDKFDVYVHLIDNQSANEEFESEEAKLISNVGFPENSHLILFSSAVIYANPDSVYAKRKTKLEKIYEEYCAKNNIRLTIFRLFNIYGKFQLPYRQGSLVANILFNYINGLPVEINDMRAKRDFIYAGDMAKFVSLAIRDGFYGRTDLATGKLVSIGDLLKICDDKIFSQKREVVNKGVVENNLCPLGNNILREKIELTGLVEGLRTTLGFYEQNSEIIKQYLKI